MNEQSQEFSIAIKETPAPDREPSTAEEIADLLQAYGVDGRVELLRDLERVLNRTAYRLAGEGLRRILLSLPATPSAIALQRAVLGNSGASLADGAKRASCSRNAVHKAEKKMRAHVARLTAGTLMER